MRYVTGAVWWGSQGMMERFYCAILPHRTEEQILLLPDGDGWRLPQWERDAEGWWQTAVVNRRVEETLGIRTTTLRCRCPVPAPPTEEGSPTHVYWLENHSPDWRPPSGARWAGRSELDEIHLTAPAHRLFLQAWFDDAGSDAPVLRSPWARTGWFDEAVAWLHRQLASLGITPTGPVEQRKAISISCLLRVPTDAGDLYMKASPTMFAVETAIAQRMAELYPGRVPSVLAVDLERRWMLMRDVGDTRLGEVTEIARWEETLRSYARMQRDFAARTPTLLQLGCRDRRLEHLPDTMDALFAERSGPAGATEGLSDEERDRLRALAPRLKAMCAELARYRVPPTLEHGDLHPWNIAVANEACTIFDWSDSCLSHPFFSMVTMRGRTGAVTDCPDAEERLRDTYLQEWTAFEPMERLREAFELAQSLGLVHQALSYDWIDAHLEESARWEWSGGATSWLQLLLKRMSE